MVFYMVFLLIYFSYRTLRFDIMKLKQIFRSNHKNAINRCIKMYLDKVFIKHSNICIVPNICICIVSQFLGKKSFRNQNTTAKYY